MFAQNTYEQLLLPFRNHIQTTVSDASKFSVYISFIYSTWWVTQKTHTNPHIDKWRCTKVFLNSILIIIIFNLRSVFHACMGWAVSSCRPPSISVFISVFTDFPFFQIISDYLNPRFLRSFSGETTTNLDISTFTTPCTFFHSFQMTKKHCLLSVNTTLFHSN